MNILNSCKYRVYGIRFGVAAGTMLPLSGITPRGYSEEELLSLLFSVKKDVEAVWSRQNSAALAAE